MYRNIFEVVPYGMRSTSSGLKVGTPGVVADAGEHNQVLLYIGKASAFPSYTNRGPSLNVIVWAPIAKVLTYTNIPGAIATSFSVDFGSQPSTARSYTVDITNWALGRIAVQANLQGDAGATARATYALTVVGKGYS
jgi:hypothetical protein